VKSHWNTDKFAEHVITPQVQSHASECEECRSEVEGFRRELEGFRDELHSVAERPGFFWAAQRTAIKARTMKASNAHGLRFALISAVALFALATALIVPATKSNTVVAINEKPRVTVPDDDALMRQVDEALLSNVPDSLEPANLIANDMNSAFSKAQKTSENK
jgi:hypothetical protein